MRTLRVGMQGADVEALQHFVNNYLDPDIGADGVFGSKETKPAVMKVQAIAMEKGLDIGEDKPDGVVGKMTTAAFMQMGWEPVGYTQIEEKVDENYAKPDYKALRQHERIAKFGTPGSIGEDGKFVLDEKFRKEITSIDIADFVTLPKDFEGSTKLFLHKKVKGQWKAILSEIEAQGLGKDLLTCGGSWAPRFVRGSRTTFSSHAFGTAIDFNVPWNYMRQTPARKGKKGYLGNIVAICKHYKVYSGAWFRRLDGMHLESTHTDEELEKMGVFKGTKERLKKLGEEKAS